MEKHHKFAELRVMAMHHLHLKAPKDQQINSSPSSAGERVCGAEAVQDHTRVAMQ